MNISTFSNELSVYLSQKNCAVLGVAEARFGDMVEVTVSADNLLALVGLLKRPKPFNFVQLTDLCGVDFLKREAENGGRRFRAVYHLLSYTHNMRLRIHVPINEGEKLPSLASVYPAACWWEREAYDMMGLMFEDAPDHRRLLTDYGFEGHPLRKDFPVMGYKEVIYDGAKKEVVYQDVDLPQAFRDFDFEGSWEGMGKLFEKDHPRFQNKGDA